MGATFVWVFIAFIALVFIGLLYDNLRCRHEWEQHKFEKGGATYYYITCKKMWKGEISKMITYLIYNIFNLGCFTTLATRSN